MTAEGERADLHVHYDTLHNGHLLDTAELNRVTVLGALQRGLVQLDKMAELVAEGEERGITVLPGAEILFKTARGYHHELIALGFDPHHPGLFKLIDPRGSSHLSMTREKIAFQTRFLAERLGLDMSVTPENQAVLEEVHSGLTAETAYKLSLAATLNPQNQRRLAEYAAKRQDQIEEHYRIRPEDQGDLARVIYWLHFSADSLIKSNLKAESAYRVWGKPLDPKKFIRVVHEANGVVVIAHPHFQHVDGEPKPYEFLPELLELGVDGLEGYYATPLQADLAEIANKSGQLILGGSGYDPSYHPRNRELGFGYVNSRDMFISPSVLEQIQDYRTKTLA